MPSKNHHYVVVNMETKAMVEDFTIPRFQSSKPADDARTYFGERQPNERIFVMLGNEDPWLAGQVLCRHDWIPGFDFLGPTKRCKKCDKLERD